MAFEILGQSGVALLYQFLADASCVANESEDPHQVLKIDFKDAGMDIFKRF